MKGERLRWNTYFDDAPRFEYQEGDFIEVSHSTGEGEALGWVLAKIITKRDSFYFVHYENYDRIYDEIVMEEQIRPVNTRPTLNPEKFFRKAIKVPSIISNWFTTDECDEKFESVIYKTKVFNVTYIPEDNEIVIVGEKKPVDRAAMLVSFIIDHQKDLDALAMKNKSMLKNLENIRSKVKGESVEEVLVPKELLGIIIGKSGANISFIKQEFGVKIHIIEPGKDNVKDFTDTEVPENKALIRIFGNSSEYVAEAKNYIQLQRVTIPIEKDKIDYLKGYNHSIVSDIKSKSGCVKIFIHDPEEGSNEGVIEAIGNEEAIEKLNLVLETHMEYYPKYEMEKEKSKELSEQTKSYQNYEGFYDKPRGGRGRGRRN